MKAHCPHCGTSMQSAVGLLEHRTRQDQARLLPIKRAVAEAYGFTTDDLDGYRRGKVLSEARHVAFYLSMKDGVTSQRVALAFNKLDHSTVLHGRENIYERVRDDHQFSLQVAKIEARAKALEAA